MFQLDKKRRYLWSVISGLMMVFAFPYTGSFFPLIFIALVPLLLVENHIYINKLRPSNVFVHSYITFFIYNLGTTYWIWFASPEGAIFAFILNSLIMALVFQLFHFTKRSAGTLVGMISLVIYWVGFEYIHYHWELSWPWLNLGNTFANQPQLIQWYSLFGVLGGTFWILIINILVFKIVYAVFILKQTWKKQRNIGIGMIAILLIPITISWIQYATYEEQGIDTEIVITQPNIDPYNEKFTGSVEQQLNTICDLADEQTTDQTDFVLAPETALPFSFYEEEVKRIIYYPYLVDRKAKWPNASLLIGASTQRYFKKKRSRASIKIQGGPGYEEYYNSSMLIDHLDRPSFIHKSKLVLGVEKIPFSNIFPFLETLAIQNGGTSGTLGVENSPQVFKSKGITFAPVVCYESIYGEFIAEQCKRGAKLIFVITNDGWWKDTPGYKQHMAFSRLRAIENRKSVARSANTGTSAFINQRGDVLQASGWWVKASMKETLKRNSVKTFYTKHGDFAGKSFAMVSILLIIIAIVKRFAKSRGNWEKNKA